MHADPTHLPVSPFLSSALATSFAKQNLKVTPPKNKTKQIKESRREKL